MNAAHPTISANAGIVAPRTPAMISATAAEPFAVRKNLALIHQLVSELLHRDEGFGQWRQLFAEAAHMDVDRARPARVAITPDLFEQDVPRQHAAAMLQQIREQEKFLRRERDLAAVERDDVPVGIHDDGAVGERA